MFILLTFWSDLDGDIYLSLEIFIHDSAFTPPDAQLISKKKDHIYSEKSSSPAPSKRAKVGGDTPASEAEKALRHRKHALNKLFTAVELRPVQTNQVLTTHKTKDAFSSKRSILEHFDGKAERLVKKDMDSDEDELEEEVVNKVYERATKNDAYLPYGFFLALRSAMYLRAQRIVTIVKWNRRHSSNSLYGRTKNRHSSMPRLLS
jgi:hypothetical protein